MNRTFYRSLVTNKIFDDNDLKRFCQIDNGVSLRSLFDAKKIIIIDTPTIEEAINNCINNTTAVFLYRDKYKCSVTEAHNTIKWLRGDNIYNTYGREVFR